MLAQTAWSQIFRQCWADHWRLLMYPLFFQGTSNWIRYVGHESQIVFMRTSQKNTKQLLFIVHPASHYVSHHKNDSKVNQEQQISIEFARRTVKPFNWSFDEQLRCFIYFPNGADMSWGWTLSLQMAYSNIFLKRNLRRDTVRYKFQLKIFLQFINYLITATAVKTMCIGWRQLRSVPP